MLSGCLLVAVMVCGCWGHAPRNPNLWECHCWDYQTNEAFKRLSKRPTTQPSVIAPTQAPLPANWPLFLKPEFWENGGWQKP